MPGNHLKGAAEPRAGRQGAQARGLPLACYSLLLRSDTDCKAVLFFSRAAFCCCDTEQERHRVSCHPRVTYKDTQGRSRPPWEKAGIMAKGTRVAKPSAGGWLAGA